MSHHVLLAIRTVAVVVLKRGRALQPSSGVLLPLQPAVLRLAIAAVAVPVASEEAEALVVEVVAEAASEAVAA
jgi:hypothetical protein